MRKWLPGPRRQNLIPAKFTFLHSTPKNLLSSVRQFFCYIRRLQPQILPFAAIQKLSNNLSHFNTMQHMKRKMNVFSVCCLLEWQNVDAQISDCVLGEETESNASDRLLPVPQLVISYPPTSHHHQQSSSPIPTNSHHHQPVIITNTNQPVIITNIH